MAARARAMAAALDDGPIMMAVIGDGRWSRQILLRYNTIITPEFLFVCFLCECESIFGGFVLWRDEENPDHWFPPSLSLPRYLRT